ncbi:helicase HerA domain-containing protein [Actinosynnema sp.]|uniref:helicase HerA domain-containing protein n=1 Tax=Actinosynnema sp. TaxID=1872144 RepID=UPI003F863EAF
MTLAGPGLDDERRNALQAVHFNSAVAPDDVWSPLAHHVPELHGPVAAELARAVASAARKPRSTPIGVVLRGERGVGKTHLLGWLRQEAQARGGWFFLLKLLDDSSFWAGAVHGAISGLNREGDQLGAMLDALAKATGHTDESRLRLRGTIPISREYLDELVDRVRELDPQVALECQDTLRALVLYRARGRPSEVGHRFLALEDGGIDEADRAEWGFHLRSRSAQLVLGDLSRIFALTGPVVMAVDQIDSVITQRPGTSGLADRLADGLMRLREETRRTVLVVACLPRSWELLAERSVNSAASRFAVLDLRTAMPSAGVAEAIVQRHLGALYAEEGFAPPHPTWPVARAAFGGAEVAHSTPRRLLQRVEEHVRWCLAHDVEAELRDFAADRGEGPAPEPDADGLAELDERFARACEAADVTSPLDPAREDELVPGLLSAALRCYAVEHGGDLVLDQPPGRKPALHARLRLTLDEASEDEVWWSFRAIAHGHSTAVLARLRSACLEAGVFGGTGKRRLVVLRGTPFSGGPRTAKAVGELVAAGGEVLPLTAEDLRVFSALRELVAQAPAGLLAWLAARTPASRTPLLRRVLPPVGAGRAGSDHSSGQDEPVWPEQEYEEPIRALPDVPQQQWPSPRWPERGWPAAEPTRLAGNLFTPRPGAPDPFQPDSGWNDAPAAHDATITLGADATTGRPFTLPLVLLRKHVAVFAGTGSGKTVLLRRLVEEAALHGVSSILLDTNNDLARLGDAWPSPPEGWSPGDADRAHRYLSGTDVVVWTPGRESGRPLVLDPLPDFGAVRADPDEFRGAVDAAVAGLLPKIALSGRRLVHGRAVLTEALAAFAGRGGRDVAEFAAFLHDLPEGASTMRDAVRLAAEMADSLHAAIITDPLFGGSGHRLDPGELLRPPPGARARVSVISCVGLPTDGQRQAFAHQLQQALFAWVRRNPAGDRPLGGLLVLDEAQTFAPSRGEVVSSASTRLLAAQARKYGLGVVFATQAPKGLHNSVTGNTATQFFGRLTAPAQFQAALDLAAARGGRVDDVSRLNAGRFYGATEGTGFTKLSLPMCLSHHPQGALTEVEVLARARP